MTPSAPGLVWTAGPAAPELHRPVLVVALRGWFDLGGSATGAVAHLLGRYPPHPLGHLDAEEFVDLSTHRPTIRYRDGVVASLTWPHTTLTALRTGGRHDLVVATGVEPDVRWRTFADALVTVARHLGAELVVTVGAAAAQVPHTRPQPVTASASTPELARRLGLGLPTYQGPTGVAGVLQDRLARAGVPGIAVRVGVPGYLGSEANPPGTQALLARLGDLLDVATGAADLDPEVAQWRAAVDEAVRREPGGPAFVAALERQVDALVTEPDADRLVEELERYLRSGDDPDGPSGQAQGPPD
jgi:hypothetical protein